MAQSGAVLLERIRAARMTGVWSLYPTAASDYLNDRPVTINGACLSPRKAMLERVAGFDGGMRGAG